MSTRWWPRPSKSFGGVDIMVNNAGYTHKNQSLMNVTEEEFDRIFDVNVKSIYLATLACVPVMEKRGGGVIINTASTAGLRPRPGLTWYNGSKGAAIIADEVDGGRAGAEEHPRLRHQPGDRRDRHAGAVHGHARTRPRTAPSSSRRSRSGACPSRADIANAALFLASPGAA